jgi:hypothetical protein
MCILDGDVYDIGQTVNGCQRFLYIDNMWYYFDEQILHQYEYDLEELIKLVSESDYVEVKFLGNIFKWDIDPKYFPYWQSLTQEHYGFMNMKRREKKLKELGI